MGSFAKKVRRNQIAGPNRMNFDRERWLSELDNILIDDEDKRVIETGLYIDELLDSIRKMIKVSEVKIKPSVIKRLLVGIVSYNLVSIFTHKDLFDVKQSEDKTIKVPVLMQQKIKTILGESFAPDELITGMGDGLKFIIRELIKLPELDSYASENSIKTDDLKIIINELNYAMLYQIAVELWNDTIGNGFWISRGKDRLSHVAFDKNREVARIASIYRREKNLLENTMGFVEVWFNKLTRSQKEMFCQFPLAENIYLCDYISKIDLGMSKKVLDDAIFGINDKLTLETEYYKLLLNDQLPNFYNLTLIQLIDGWRLLHSIARLLFKELSRISNKEYLLPADIIKFAPKISFRILCATFVKALRIDCETAEKIIQTLTYTGDYSQEIWTQPLIECDGDYLIVLPCIHTVKFYRIVEGWMRQGGLSLDRRGPEFEQFCIDDLKDSLKGSKIESDVVILGPSIKFRPKGDREEEIDIVLIIAGTVLLVELKCILWPDDSLQFANYHDTIENAVQQIVRKRDSVKRNFDSFVRNINEYGVTIANDSNVICCVLTNSAIYSGFPIEGTPIVDTKILGRYFLNEHVIYDIRKKGKSIKRKTISFYDDSISASVLLENYLLYPPQVKSISDYVVSRSVEMPLEHETYGKLVHETFSVEIDLDTIIKKESMYNGEIGAEYSS